RGARSAPVAVGAAVGAGAGSFPLRCCDSSAAAASPVPMRMSAIRCQIAARDSLRSRSMSTVWRSVPDVDDSQLGKEIERGGAAFAIAEARILHAAKGDLRLAADRWDVHVHHPRLRLLGVTEGGAEVAGIDRRGQSVADGVR